MTPLPLPIIILAAGQSARMRGADKLMEEIAGQPLLVDRVQAALATGQPVLVTLPPRGRSPARWAAIADLPVAAVEVRNADLGLSASIGAGIEALPEGAMGVMLMLADMPEITPEDMLRVLAEFDGEFILRGTSADGRPGHPVVFPVRDFPELVSLDGDEGARPLFDHNHDRVRPVSLPFNHARTDLDTPEEWDAWRAAGPGP